MRCLLALFPLTLLGCGSPPPAATTTPAEPTAAAPIVGETTREAVLAAERAWRTELEASKPDAAAAAALASVPAGARVDVYFGTWCSDSLHEVPRLWKALDLAGRVPFELRWIGVDRNKRAPEVTDALGLKRVPTFVVTREEREVGRIVEHAPRGIETELAELLSRDSGARSDSPDR